MIKKLALAILLAYSTSVFAQTSTVSTTGNLIDPNAWNGVTYMTPEQLGAVEGTGGGPTPAFNTGTNTIRFSFMPYTASQIQAINAAMFNNNTNIQVSGYNYSWRLYGDNGYLMVLGKLYDTKGAVLEQANYNYMFSPAMPMNWDLISGTGNFSKAYDFKTLGSFEFSATGSDSLFWSGYYGPRIRDINVSFNYSILPAPTTTTTNTTGTKEPTPLEIADAFSKPPPESDATTQQTQPPPSGSSPPPPGSEPPPGSSPPPPGSSPPPSNEQVRVADAGSPNTNRPREERSQISASSNTSTNTAKTESSTTSGPSLSSIMSMIQSNQARENNIAMSAVAQSNEVAQSAVAQAEKTAIETAITSLAQSLDVAKNSIRSETKDNKTNVNSSLSLLPSSSGPVVMQGSSNIVQQSQMLSNQLNLPINPALNQQQSTNNINNNNITLGLYNRPETTITAPAIVQEVSQPLEIKPSTANNINIQPIEQSTSNSSLFAKRGDPLTDYIEQNNIMIAMAQPEIKSTSVKTNVQDNDLAAGVRIERMAVVPTGFNAYTNYMLRDVAFYAPKEIYRNQKTIDNTRALRQLSSDKLHQEMVEQQYRR
jgi:hypothetical protein